MRLVTYEGGGGAAGRRARRERSSRRPRWTRPRDRSAACSSASTPPDSRRWASAPPRATNDSRSQSVRLLAPVPDPEKIICLGLNYRDHAEESGQEIAGSAALVRQVRQLADRQRERDRAARGPPRVRRLRGRARRGDRASHAPRRGRSGALARRRSDAVQRRQRPGSAVAEPAVDERQGDRHVRALRPRARDTRGGRRPRGSRPAHADQRRVSPGGQHVEPHLLGRRRTSPGSPER